MARYIHPSRKKRLTKASRQTKWAPFWLVPKIFGKGVVAHPSRITTVKRNWRKKKIKA